MGILISLTGTGPQTASKQAATMCPITRKWLTSLQTTVCTNTSNPHQGGQHIRSATYQPIKLSCAAPGHPRYILPQYSLGWTRSHTHQDYEETERDSPLQVCLVGWLRRFHCFQGSRNHISPSWHRCELTMVYSVWRTDWRHKKFIPHKRSRIKIDLPFLTRQTAWQNKEAAA